MKKGLAISAAIVIVGGLVAAYFYFFRSDTSPRSPQVEEFINDPGNHPDWMIKAGSRCSNAPFILPTSGFIGYLWGDTFDPSHLHQGIDIFGGNAPGMVPVIAAADGFLTRLPDWKSSVIVRIPSDPLQPGRQIWTYYTHMADENGESQIAQDFPPGTQEMPIKAGTVLGNQGNYSGIAGRTVAVHLHFSIVLDDGRGGFRNELDIANTLDPSPYLGLTLNAKTAGPLPLACQ